MAKLHHQHDFLVRMLLIGDSGAGKTAMLIRYASEAFSTTHITTIGIDFKIKHINIDGKRIKLQIWDTAGQERFRTITQSYYRGSDIVLIIYDVTDRSTFNNVDYWLNDMKEKIVGDINIILVGNKSDLIEKRVVKYEEGEKIADGYKVKFFETSAKTGFNINELFECAAKKILNKKIIINNEDIVHIKPKLTPIKCC